LPKADAVRLVASAKADGYYAMRSAAGHTCRLPTMVPRNVSFSVRLAANRGMVLTCYP
jgi:hypothetical protein